MGSASTTSTLPQAPAPLDAFATFVQQRRIALRSVGLRRGLQSTNLSGAPSAAQGSALGGAGSYGGGP